MEDKLFDIALLADYDVVETTSGINGYPKDLQYAITGFKYFDEAQEFAEENGLTLISLHKRDGVHLWERGKAVNEPYKNPAELFGENYSQFSFEDESSYFEDNVRPYLSNFDNMDDLELFLKNQSEIMDELSFLSVDQVVLLEDGEYYDTVDKEMMSYSYDTHNYTIGAISK